jgi:hypothetical protein
LSAPLLPVAQQRCWNHESREAACRCPECRRNFCRECVTEHESRLLCATCLKGVTARRPRMAFGRMLPAGMALGGILLAWILLFGAGETLAWVVTRMEQTSWHSR